MRSIAFLILVLAVLLIGIVVAIENQPQRLPLIQAASPNPDPKMPAWRLMTLCPVGRSNVPTLPDERTA